MLNVREKVEADTRAGQDTIQFYGLLTGIVKKILFQSIFNPSFFKSFISGVLNVFKLRR